MAATGPVEAVDLVYQPQAMYNLTVASAHTYFVGDGGYLVHNRCRLHGHHPWPTYLGGPKDQPLYYFAGELHLGEYHKQLDEWLHRTLGARFYEQLFNTPQKKIQLLESLLEFNRYFDETYGEHTYDALVDVLRYLGLMPKPK